jgi:hypothetical protein
MMRTSLILGLVSGIFIGIMLGSQAATSQEEMVPMPEREGRGRFQIAGHSTYPPLLLDSETGTAWILMSDTDGEERRWIWEPIEIGVIPENPSQSKGRDIARAPEISRPPQHQIATTRSRSLSW